MSSCLTRSPVGADLISGSPPTSHKAICVKHKVISPRDESRCCRHERDGEDSRLSGVTRDWGAASRTVTRWSQGRGSHFVWRVTGFREVMRFVCFCFCCCLFLTLRKQPLVAISHQAVDRVMSYKTRKYTKQRLAAAAPLFIEADAALYFLQTRRKLSPEKGVKAQPSIFVDREKKNERTSSLILTDIYNSLTNDGSVEGGFI